MEDKLDWSCNFMYSTQVDSFRAAIYDDGPVSSRYVYGPCPNLVREIASRETTLCTVPNVARTSSRADPPSAPAPRACRICRSSSDFRAKNYACYGLQCSSSACVVNHLPCSLLILNSMTFIKKPLWFLRLHRTFS